MEKSELIALLVFSFAISAHFAFSVHRSGCENEKICGDYFEMKDVLVKMNRDVLSLVFAGRSAHDLPQVSNLIKTSQIAPVFLTRQYFQAFDVSNTVKGLATSVDSGFLMTLFSAGLSNIWHTLNDIVVPAMMTSPLSFQGKSSVKFLFLHPATMVSENLTSSGFYRSQPGLPFLKFLFGDDSVVFIEDVQTPLFVHTLFWGMDMTCSSLSLNPDHCVTAYERIREIMYDRVPMSFSLSKAGPKVFFLSRRDAEHKRIVNENEIVGSATAMLENRFGTADIVVDQLSNKAFSAQARMFMDADIVLAFRGAGTVLSLAMKPGSILFVIESKDEPGFYPFLEKLPWLTVVNFAVDDRRCTWDHQEICDDFSGNWSDHFVDVTEFSKTFDQTLQQWASNVLTNS